MFENGVVVVRTFENQVQLVKYEVLKEVARLTFQDQLEALYVRIPGSLNPGPEPRFRCCIHHERAVTKERIKMAMGGTPAIPGVVEVLDAACDQCPVSRYKVTESCRGCLAHRCQAACPVGAIQVIQGKAIIDESKCVECGRCQSSCPYNAIVDTLRPCMKACPVDALSINAQKKAVIDYRKCIQCGACVYNCPFGAIQDKSEIVPIIRALMAAQRSGAPQVYAIIAPAFASQYNYANLGQIITGIKRLGFRDVVEAALGADLVAVHEAGELLSHLEHHRYMTSSCCPAFVDFIHKKHPQVIENVSGTVSPMIAASKLIKAVDPSAVTVFIGPCIAKKAEKALPDLAGITDYVMTFEELLSLLDAREIHLEALPESPMNNASYYGRIFAGAGGLSKAVEATALKLAPASDVKVVAVAGDGIKACDKLLKLAKANRLEGNFIEGMACEGGCIKGPVSLHHGAKDLKALEAYAKMALEEDALAATRIFGEVEIALGRWLEKELA